MLGYSKRGKGKEKVMVVHGWKTDQSCFDPIISSLDLEAYTYVFVDQRGYGRSINQEGPYTINQVALDMISLANELGWEKFHIIGHSMGGKVIQQVIVDYPGKIKSAIGITPCPACALPFDDQGWRLFSGADTDIEKRLQIFRLSTGDRYTDTWYKTITEKSIAASKTEAFRAYLDSWVNDDLVKEIDGCTVPIKLIIGEHDPDMNAEVMQSTFGKWFTDVKIVSLSNCGHYPMMESPLLLAAECESFLKLHE